jgi:hypothetical protein
VAVSAAAPPFAAAIQLARKPNTYTLSKPFVAGLKGRSDSAVVKAHFKAIDGHFDKYKLLAARAERLVAKHKKTGNLLLERRWAKKARAARAKMTEAIGELNATNKILRERPHWSMLRGFAAGTGFDQIWRSPSGKLSIVEAKGPGARLGFSDRKGAQMSKSWVELTAKSLENDFGIGKSLTKGKPKARGYVITSTPTGLAAQKNWHKLAYN